VISSVRMQEAGCNAAVRLDASMVAHSQHGQPLVFINGSLKAQLVEPLRGLVEARGKVEQPRLA
jgi:hypothetical protein